MRKDFPAFVGPKGRQGLPGNVSIVLLLRIAYAIRAARDDAASLCRGPVSVAAIARLS